MDDFNINCLRESKNEWISRLIYLLTPEIIKGFRSIFEESINLCQENKEKYLMTFQNLISRIPKWNSTIIEQEKNRIIENTKCGYLEDLISCVHIIQLKTLTAMRVGSEQKKIDIHIPKLEEFLHKVYIQSARKLYLNVYLYEIQTSPLTTQKNNREIELIIQECILTTIRENIPIGTLLKVYLDETTEDVITEEIKEEIIHKEVEIIPEKKEEVIPVVHIPEPSIPEKVVLPELEEITLPPPEISPQPFLEEVNLENLLDEKKEDLPEIVFDEIDFS